MRCGFLAKPPKVLALVLDLALDLVLVERNIDTPVAMGSTVIAAT
jgi:hypothetical protein